MKSLLTYPTKSLLGLACAVLLLASACTAKAQILLKVDISNTDAVTITASGTYTGAGASSSLNNGIDLLNIFTNDAGIGQVTINSTGLTTGAGDAGGAVYDTVYPDNQTFLSTPSDLVNNTDLSLYSSNESAPETFTTDVSGFSNSISLNLSGDSFQSVGYIGNIIIGYSGTNFDVDNTPTIIGQYEIVSDSISAPEPSTWVLLFLGLAALVVRYLRPRLSDKLAVQKK
jgi:hypothetical protein